MRADSITSKLPFAPARLGGLLLGAALSSLTPSAFAQVNSMAAHGNYALDGAPFASLVDNYPSNGAGNVEVVNYNYGNSSSTALHSYGNANGTFGSRASGMGVYQVNGGFQVVQSFTNTSSVAQLGSFRFQITPGMLQNNIGTPLTGDQYVEAGLTLDLKRGSQSLWNSAASLRSDASGTAFHSSGDASLYSGGDALYIVNGLSRDVDLGIIKPGETVQLTYTLGTYANGVSVAGAGRWAPPVDFIVPEGWDSWEGCVPGDKAAATMGSGICGAHPGDLLHTDGYWRPGDISASHASVGDPFAVGYAGYFFSAQSDGNTLGPLRLAPVPEPSGGAMLLVGMGLMAVLAARGQRPGRQDILAKRQQGS